SLLILGANGTHKETFDLDHRLQQRTAALVCAPVCPRWRSRSPNLARPCQNRQAIQHHTLQSRPCPAAKLSCPDHRARQRASTWPWETDSATSIRRSAYPRRGLFAPRGVTCHYRPSASASRVTPSPFPDLTAPRGHRARSAHASRHYHPWPPTIPDPSL